MSRLADAVLILTCLVVGAIAITRQFGVPAPRATAPGYEVGEVVGDFGIDFDGRAATIVLYLQTDCRYCAESMPFYRRLIEGFGGKSDANVVVVGYEEEATLRRYADENGLAAAQVRSIALGSAKFIGSPTVLVVRSDGSVAKEWRGLLPGSSEAEIVKLAMELRGPSSR